MPAGDEAWTLTRADGARVAALAVVAALLLLVPLARSQLAAAPLAPWPSCAAGAARARTSGVVGCDLVAGERLEPRQAFLLGTPLELNLATAAELTLVPGIGEKLAARIVLDRAERGPFPDVAALRRVRGVGPKLVALLARHVRVSEQSPRRLSDPADSPAP